MRGLLIIASVLLQSLLMIAHTQAGERVALVIGNADYQKAPRLPNPINDASDVAAALERLGFSVKLIRDGTFDSMRKGLLDFAQQVQGADIAVTYFAGHGMEIRDENWLIPIDAELRMDVSAGQEAVSLSSILPIVAKARKLGLVLLDACRDNPFSRRILMSQPGRSVGPRGLLPVEPPNSVLIAFAAKHGTTADDGGGRNSPFTRALLDNLEVPGLEINYLFRNVHDEVYAATKQQQEPYIYGTLSKEPIYLKAATTQTVNPAAVNVNVSSYAKPTSEAERAWALTKDTTNRVVLQAFIKRFGDTFYGDLANARLRELDEVRSPDKVALAVPPPPQPVTTKVFENPAINGIRIDVCLRTGAEGCYAPAATFWCRSNGFSRATNWSIQTVQPTIFQDSRNSSRTCNLFFCKGFKRIACE